MSLSETYVMSRRRQCYISLYKLDRLHSILRPHFRKRFFCIFSVVNWNEEHFSTKITVRREFSYKFATPKFDTKFTLHRVIGVYCQNKINFISNVQIFEFRTICSLQGNFNSAASYFSLNCRVKIKKCGLLLSTILAYRVQFLY